MTTQPTALELADALEEPVPGFPLPTRLETAAAAELRRLHALNAELAEALKIIATAENSALDLAYCKGVARAAIAKGEK